MKKIIFLFIILSLVFISCNNSNQNYNNESNDSIMLPNGKYSIDEINVTNEPIRMAILLEHAYPYYQKWFTEFEKNNPNWLNEKNGLQKFKKAFNEKMSSDIKFVKYLMLTEAKSEYEEYTENKPKILLSESLCKATVEDKIGEMKVFLMYITVKLSKPMYNGQDEIDIYYEIVNFIPSTEKNHQIPYTGDPYVNNVDTCIIADGKPYFHNRNVSGKIIGTYFVGNKKK